MMLVTRRRAMLLVLAALPLCAAIDPVHSMMELPPPKLQRPRVSSPVVGGPRLQRAGLLAALLSPSRALLLLPAALMGLAVAFPEPMARFALHVLCFLGSLFEPFDTGLPAKHPLRFFVDQVQHARRAFEVKHGLEGLRSPMNFFDDADDEADDADAEEGGDGDVTDAADPADAAHKAQGEVGAEAAAQESSEE